MPFTPGQTIVHRNNVVTLVAYIGTGIRSNRVYNAWQATDGNDQIVTIEIPQS